MKTHSLLILAAACVSSAGIAASVPAASAITAVTVYTDRAVVTRTAAVEIAAPGTAEIVFDRLPPSLVDASLNVSGRGTAGATILDVAARETHTSVSQNERAQAIEQDARALARQRRTLEDRVGVLKAQEASLSRLESTATAAPTKDGAPRLPIEELARFLAFLEEQRSKQAAERQALDAQLEELSARQGAIEGQLAALRQGGRRSYKTVTVRVATTAPGRLELALSYAVPGASWTPAYDARAQANAAELELGYFGIVRQHTGEDWKDVALTLSTARPSLGGAAPEIGTWALDVHTPRAQAPTTVGGALKLEAFEVSTGSAGTRPRPPAAAPPPAYPAEANATLAQATVEAVATSASFRVATKATVPSDNSPQKIPVMSTPLAATPEYVATPKRLPAAFLTAKVTNTSEFPLLPGAINIFLDGTFVATGQIRGVMPGEKFDLALGADEGIAVQHKRVQRFTEETGLTSSGRRVTYEFLTTIQNNKRSPARVIVNDHLPVSRHERIVVKVLTPGEKELKPASDGTVKWTLDLKPGEKRELTLKFNVEHPAELYVAGWQ